MSTSTIESSNEDANASINTSTPIIAAHNAHLMKIHVFLVLFGGEMP
jgi:hypothetical protein